MNVDFSKSDLGRRVMLTSAPVALAAGLVFGGIGCANATTIDFSSYSTGTALTSLDGITFSLEGGPDSSGPPLVGYGSDEPTGLSNSTNPDYPTADILNFAFSSPVSGVSFYFNDYGTDGYGSYYDAYGPGDVLVASGSLTGQAGTVDNIVSASDIVDIQFNNNAGSNSWYFAVNSLTFSSGTPEPATWSLMLAGVFGLGAAIRRRRARPASA